MNNIKIWHNNNCSKSRKALEILNSKDINVNVIEYLDADLTKDILKDILKMLNMNPKELMRKDENIYLELNLKDENDKDKLIEAMINNPILIQRPIIIKDNKAVIARPMDNIDKLF